MDIYVMTLLVMLIATAAGATLYFCDRKITEIKEEKLKDKEKNIKINKKG